MMYFKLEYHQLFFKRALAGLLEIIEHLIIIVKLYLPCITQAAPHSYCCCSADAGGD